MKPIDKEPRPTSWWHTLPGMLTALAGVVTAVTGLLIALNQLGIFPRSDAPTASSTSPADSGSLASSAAVVRTPGNAGPAPAAPAATDAPLLEPTRSEVRVGEGRYQILSITTEQQDLQRFSMKIGIRLFNESRYDIGFWDDSFRLLIDSIPRAPVSGLSTTASSRSAEDGEIEFANVPMAASSLVLSVSYQGEEALIPLRISRR